MNSTVISDEALKTPLVFTSMTRKFGNGRGRFLGVSPDAVGQSRNELGVSRRLDSVDRSVEEIARQFQTFEGLTEQLRVMVM